MANKETENCEKFKTMIGGQALIEGIMMRGPEKDAIVIRGQGRLDRGGFAAEAEPARLMEKLAVYPGHFQLLRRADRGREGAAEVC